MILDAGNIRAARTGNLAGWAAAFLTAEQARAPAPGAAALLIGHADYFAAIEVALPGDLSGGRFSLTVEAMTDAHYKDARGAVAVELFLFWQDVNANLGGYFTNLVGVNAAPDRAALAPALVGRFAIRQRRRGLGRRGGDAVFEGRDLAYDRLATHRAPLVCADGLGGLLRVLSSAAGIPIAAEPSETELLPPGTPPAAEQTGSGGEARSVLAEIQALAERIAADLREDAPAVALPVNGTLHLGRRSIPFPAGGPVDLDLPGGLASATAEADANAVGGRRGWRLLLRGRPDLRPGGVVRFKAPEEEVLTTTPSFGTALAGAFAGLAGGFGGPEPPDTAAYVTSVTHRMSRQSGLQTEVTALELPFVLPANPWSLFQRSEADGPARPARDGDAAANLGRQVRGLARSVLGRLRLPEVAEVRDTAAAPPATPAMTLTAWEGTSGFAGESHTLRRHPPARARASEHRAVTTLTPFAWGACGLALPRYPGMRVMLGFRNGLATEPYEFGATWGPGARMTPQAGDWWLCLPRNAPAAALPPTDTADHEPGPDTPATHDLIDAAGNRVIQVGKLTLRIGPDADAKAGTRPASESAAFSLRHADGKAEITMDANGAITIRGERISLDAGSNGTVSINARDVDVSVANRMNVT
ncbi:hypothetical protein [Roseomonas sp. BN140053]|uniref:hypothetical protein n=1 Tax=Roseomonas sp. BN140053 TaxID=3391898 RepID=UPI0039EB690A